MEAAEKVKVLQAMYAGVLADAVLRMGRERILEKVEAEKKEELKVTGAMRARQLGITRAEDVMPALSELMGCADWTVAAREDGSGFIAAASRCMLCAMAKKLGAPSPCRIYCLDPMEAMVKGLEPDVEFNMLDTLYHGTECRVDVK